MDKFSQERLNLLFEVENIKMPLVNYISPGVNLKVVTELGGKDKFGCKRRFYEEVRYPSNKYSNTDHLISANFRINTYLVFEYPNVGYVSNGQPKNNGILIKGYAMDDLIDGMKSFSKEFINGYRVIDNKLVLLSDKVKSVKVYPSLQSSIEFSSDIYEDAERNIREMGVRITLNNEFSFVISAETIWPELVYRISRCDLTLMGIQMVQSYMALLPGMATTDINSGYTGSAKYSPYWQEDPDEIVNRPSSVGVKKGKSTTREGKINDFFNNL